MFLILSSQFVVIISQLKMFVSPCCRSDAIQLPMRAGWWNAGVAADDGGCLQLHDTDAAWSHRRRCTRPELSPETKNIQRLVQWG